MQKEIDIDILRSSDINVHFNTIRTLIITIKSNQNCKTTQLYSIVEFEMAISLLNKVNKENFMFF